MKRIFITAIALSAIVNDAHALRVLTSEHVTIEKQNIEVAKAFRDREACRVWYWMPTVFETYTTARHYIDPISVRIPGTQKDEVALASKFEFGAEPLVNFSEVELREKISNYVNQKLAGADIPEDYKGCLRPEQTTVSANDIALNIIPVRKVQGAIRDRKKTTDSEGYQSLKVPMAGNGNVYSSPLAKFNVEYLHDATALAARQRANDWVGKKPGELLGDLVFDVDGVEKGVHSLYSVKGKLSAKFKSDLKKTSCTVSHSENDNAAMGAAIGAIVGGGFVGAAIGSQMFGGSESSTTVCQYNIVTEMLAGNVDMHMKLEHKSDLRGKYKEVCVDEECRPVPLQDWVEKKLLVQFVLANMDIILQRVGEEVFATTTPKGIFNGRDGDSSVDINIVSEIEENIFKDVRVKAKIHKSAGMSASVNAYMFEDETVSCFRTRFWTQRAKYPQLGNHNFIPVDFSCVNP